MTTSRLEEMTRGWFVGDFEPSALRTSAVEVGVKRYRAGDREAWHYHKVATEVTLVLEGEAEMNGVRHVAGDIVRLDPGEGTNFVAITEVTTVVMKLPSAKGDKYVA